MKRVYGSRKESADHDKGLMTMLRVHRTIKVKSLRTIKEKSPRTVKKVESTDYKQGACKSLSEGMSP